MTDLRVLLHLPWLLAPVMLLVVLVVVVVVAVGQASQPPACRRLSFEYHGTVVATTEPVALDNSRRCS